jgi:diacylglycerol O-acyltransferase
MRKLFFKQSCPESNQVAHPTDLAFHYLESPTTPQNIGCFALLDRNPDLPLLHERFEKVVDFFPRLRRQLIPKPLRRGARSGWMPSSNFSLREHIEIHRLPPIATEEDVRHLVESVFPTPLPENKPRWKFVIITNRSITDTSMSAGGIAAIVLIFHHSVTDGLGGMEVLNALTSNRHPDESSHRNGRRGASPMRLRWNLRLLFSAIRIVRTMLRQNPPRCLSCDNSRARRIAYGVVPLPALRQLRRSLGGSLNDAFLFGVTAAVRPLLEQTPCAEKLSEPVAIMPVSLRSLDARNELGNYLTGVGIPLPIGQTDGSLCMSKIRHRTAMLKEQNVVESYILLSELGARLPRKLQPYFFKTLARTTSFICTNVPESAQPRSLAGAKILQKYGLPALMKGHALGFALITYAQQACFAVVTDPALNIDPASLIERIQTEFADWSSPST